MILPCLGRSVKRSIKHMLCHKIKSRKKLRFFSKKGLTNTTISAIIVIVLMSVLKKNKALRDGVMVAQVTLDHSVWVRVLVPEPNGAMVKRLRRRPLKAKSRVRFPLALPTRLKHLDLMNLSAFLLYNFLRTQTPYLSTHLIDA